MDQRAVLVNRTSKRFIFVDNLSKAEIQNIRDAILYFLPRDCFDQPSDDPDNPVPEGKPKSCDIWRYDDNIDIDVYGSISEIWGVDKYGEFGRVYQNCTRDIFRYLAKHQSTIRMLQSLKSKPRM